MIRNKLFYKISFGYVIIVMISLLIVGTFFINMLKSYSFEEKERNMLNRAKDITKLASVYLTEGVETKQYDSFIEILDSFASARVWVTDVNGHMLFMSRGKNCPTMSEDMRLAMCEGMMAEQDLISLALLGNDVIKQRYSNYYNVPMFIVGTPIYNDSSQVVGTVFLHSPISEITANIDRAYGFLTISVIISILLTSIMGVFYSKRITKPIIQMNSTALEMSKGNYRVLTRVNQDDEIGQLSKSIDNLAIELDHKISEIEKLEQMRKDLISNVSHEFRTPLTLIRGSTEALIDEVFSGEEERKKQYARILKEAKGLERLVNDLLDLSRLQSGKFDMHFEKVELSSVIYEVAKSLQEIAIKKSINIKTDVPENVPPIYGDYYRLRQLFIIFVDNAIKYSKENSKIEIVIDITDTVNVFIKDNGIGISQEDLPYVWERFYKADKSRGNSKAGAGLGLTIAKYLIESHKGTVKIESEIGKGTTIEINFPKNEDFK